jgi:hypothetical protein
VDIRDQAQLALASLVRGSGWIIRGELNPVRLQERDVLGYFDTLSNWGR